MREKILNKATEMFLDLGFKSVTMDDIAENLGISKKTIYAHYKTKSKLVEACSIELYNSITEGIDEIIAEELNPINEILCIHQYILKRLREEKSSPQYQLKKYYPNIDKNLRLNKMVRMKECVVCNLNRGVKEGLYRKDIRVDIVYRFYYMMLEGIKNSEYFPEENYPTSFLVKHFLDYHIRGIVSAKGQVILEKLAKNPIHEN
ncbi:TetR/AcrR family transcriptional regulator [Mesonia sp. MT50]|uniref:TetR/AcrR family transcriptional regulator n=1 Tax=Mesonia profundi TaxID=3070998 RepID=A0ABU0ZXZ3_9FLAO|nr:TetR/AcrR family transcriptional regulator [Mesonia profundi]MDQ7916338.1 TetR/AcrR family transcriptional regulator [Mesonia profundi]